MSRYFFYGTKLSEFEQMMMLVPNFKPRRKGVIVIGSTQILNEDISNQFADKTYKQLLESNFSKFNNRKLDQRLQKMMGGWEENCFLTPSHRHRFLRYYRETFSNQSCAALYLLSADEILWYRAYGHILTDEISVKNIPLQGISTDGYALYQTAKTITTGKKHIYINEIADDKLIGDFAFRAIIVGILIARYGHEILNFGQEKKSLCIK
ncbi:hypothetical protein PBV87_08005 [Niameybacter massiliensis]|uniref:Uncharacterized protein n=1 Tax=Holtiella tumoricola TaxID=3018743 RepID=A0AA42J0Q6_9FIRM|nr:hypothetical protein [Holtiella tumoricola]MDA3731418.1 hypothetical protein [Holtiella tumoricola]